MIGLRFGEASEREVTHVIPTREYLMAFAVSCWFDSATEAKSRDLHANVHAVMSNHGSDTVPYYLPNFRVPHCTLSPWVDRKKLA